MESNDSEISECLNWPSVRRDCKTSKPSYPNNFNTQQHSVTFLSQWRKPKKRNPCCSRLRRELETSTSLVFQKKATEQIFDSTSGVASYTCLPDTRIKKTTQYQVSTKSNLKKTLKKKVDKPVIQVIILPNEQGENQIKTQKAQKIANNSKNLNPIDTKNVYLVVVSENKDKVYGVQTTHTAAIAEEVYEDDVGQVSNGRFKQIVKNLTIEKKHSMDRNKNEMTQEHACDYYSNCGPQGSKCCEDKSPQCVPPPCKPRLPLRNTPLQEYPPIEVRDGRHKVTIHGQLGINQEDRFVMKCGATINDKPVIPAFFHVGVKAPHTRETAAEWKSDDKYCPEKTLSMEPLTMDKDTQYSNKYTTKEIPSQCAVEDDNSRVVVISVFPKDHDGFFKQIPRPPPRQVNNSTQDGQAQLMNRDCPRRTMTPSNAYNEKLITSMRPGRPLEVRYNTDCRDRSPNGGGQFDDYNDLEETTSKPKTNDFNLGHVRGTKVSQEVASQVMGLKKFDGEQIFMTHRIVEPRITESNENKMMTNINIRVESNTTRNISTQNDQEYKKEQRCPKDQADNNRFSSDRNETSTKEYPDQMIRDHKKIRETKNKNVNKKNSKSPNRSPSPPSKQQRNTDSHTVETRLVKRNRSQSPRTTNISANKEPKNVPSKQKTKTSATTSRKAYNTKKPKSKTKDKTNNLNKIKSKTLTADNYKKIVIDREDEYYRMSPRKDVSKISVNIDSENEYYDVSFHQGLNTTGLTVRKTLKENRNTASLQNLLCQSKILCPVKQAPANPLNVENVFESHSRFNVQDSLELSHRHSLRNEVETQIVKPHTHLSVSNNDLTSYAPVKHFTGDSCTIRNPIERDKEIQKLLGISRRVPSPMTNISQTHNLFGDRINVTQTFYDDQNRLENAQIYSNPVTVQCSQSHCACFNKGEGDSAYAKTSTIRKKTKEKKKKVEKSNLYQQIVLHRNIQVFLQVDQFNKEKPICLSKKQYDKVKKAIQITLSKNRHTLEKKQKQAEQELKCTPKLCKAIADHLKNTPNSCNAVTGYDDQWSPNFSKDHQDQDLRHFPKVRTAHPDQDVEHFPRVRKAHPDHDVEHFPRVRKAHPAHDAEHFLRVRKAQPDHDVEHFSRVRKAHLDHDVEHFLRVREDHPDHDVENFSRVRKAQPDHNVEHFPRVRKAHPDQDVEHFPRGCKAHPDQDVEYFPRGCKAHPDQGVEHFPRGCKAYPDQDVEHFPRGCKAYLDQNVEHFPRSCKAHPDQDVEHFPRGCKAHLDQDVEHFPRGCKARPDQDVEHFPRGCKAHPDQDVEHFSRGCNAHPNQDVEHFHRGCKAHPDQNMKHFPKVHEAHPDRDLRHFPKVYKAHPDHDVEHFPHVRKPLADNDDVICLKVDCATDCIESSLLAEQKGSFEEKSCKKFNKRNRKLSAEIMKKNYYRPKTDECDDFDSKDEPCICCKCMNITGEKCKRIEEDRRDSTKHVDKKSQKDYLVDNTFYHQCPFVQSFVSVGEVRLKTTRLLDDDIYTLRQNNQDLEEYPLLEEQEVEQKMEILEDVNVDLTETPVDASNDEYVDPFIMAPCEKNWLKHKLFQKLNEGAEKMDTIVLYKREQPHDIHARRTMSSMEVRYTNVALVKQVTYPSMNVVDSLVSDSSLALKDSVSVETLFKGHRKSPTPNLGTSTISYLSESSCPETPPYQKPAKKPFLRRLMSCLVMRSEKFPGPNVEQPKHRQPTGGSSVNSYHFDTSLGAIEVSSSLYDTSASFYTNHSVLPKYNKLTKRGFFSSVRGFLSYNRRS